MRLRRDLPSFLQPLHTDEYLPRPASEEVGRAIAQSGDIAEKGLRDTTEESSAYWAGRRGTAAGLLAVNQQFGADFYAVPREATEAAEAAHEALGGDEVVIDVQTHYVADRDQATASHLTEMYRLAMPSWWKGLDGLSAYSFAEYLRCVFIESETAVAVLSSSPGVENHRQLFNEELAATRRLLDEYLSETPARPGHKSNPRHNF